MDTFNEQKKELEQIDDNRFTDDESESIITAEQQIEKKSDIDIKID